MPAESTSVKRIDIALPMRLLYALSSLAEYTGMSRSDYIRMVLNSHVHTHPAKSLLHLDNQQEIGKSVTQLYP
jgi:metal-responsive CopG/Arc/MetJ family transcriptional regulator